jgi:adenine deaminase
VRFLEGIPKVELHLHIEGTLEPELLFAIATRNSVPLRFKSVAEVRKAYDFRNLQDFLDIYYEGCKVLLHEQDFYDLATAYFERVARQNVRYVELFFDPQSHTERGVSYDTVLDGLHRAQRDAAEKLGVRSGLILCFLRHLPAEQCMKALEVALPRKRLLLGVGLDSSEVGHPPRDFVALYERARAEGLHAVAHAGEEGPPDYVWQALDLLRVERVDHGNRCLEDPALVARLVREKVPLTVCPLSNVRLRVVKAIEEHPIRKMLALGLKACVNSDDPAYFGGYVEENFAALERGVGLTGAEVVTLVLNGIEATFLPGGEKEKLRAEVTKFVQQQGR